jgi:predicted acetyltransferase
MKTELARTEDFSRLKELWSVVFDEDPAFLEKFFALRFSPGHIVVAREQGRIVSALHALPATYGKDGEIHQCAYIVGAATDAAYRRQGIMSDLLSFARKTMDCPMALFPAVRPFYEQNGYFTTSTMLRFSLDRPVPDGAKDSVSLPIIELDRIFHHATKASGALMRDPLAWSFLLDGYGLLAVENGYALVKGNVAIETMAMDGESAKNLLDLLCARQVEACQVLPDSPFVALLPDSKATVLQMGMSTDREMEGVYIAEQY